MLTNRPYPVFSFKRSEIHTKGVEVKLVFKVYFAL